MCSAAIILPILSCAPVPGGGFSSSVLVEKHPSGQSHRLGSESGGAGWGQVCFSSEAQAGSVSMGTLKAGFLTTTPAASCGSPGFTCDPPALMLSEVPFSPEAQHKTNAGRRKYAGDGKILSADSSDKLF